MKLTIGDGKTLIYEYGSYCLRPFPGQSSSTLVMMREPRRGLFLYIWQIYQWSIIIIMEKMIGKVINRRKALKTIAGLFGERFLWCLSAEESSNKYSWSDLLEAGQEISNIARDFITTRTLTPKNMTKMVIHIGQEHQHTSLPLEHTTRPMVERVVAIQKNIANILDTTMKFRGSPLFSNYTGDDIAGNA